MGKLFLSQLVIELTRKCNLECAHCLRGQSQNININTEYINILFSQIRCIDHLTFSGGEPSLNVNAIEHTLNAAKHYGVTIGSFYIATNGVNIPEDFVIACLKWYAYCEDKKECQIQVSNDYWHCVEDNYNTELLDGLSFFSRKFKNDGEHNINLINQGFQKECCNCGQELQEEAFKCIEEALLYLNCKGNIINGCDWSYIEQNEHIICKVEELISFKKKG